MLYFRGNLSNTDMSVPPFSSTYYAAPASQPKSSKAPWLRWLLSAGILLISILGFSSHSSAAVADIKSLAGNYCVDLEHNHVASGTAVNSRGCNSDPAQAWTVQHDSITHSTGYCLAVANDSTQAGSPIILASCSDAPGQVWLQDQKGLINPNSNLCLTLPSNTSGQLTVEHCATSSNKYQQWQAANLSPTALGHQCAQLANGDRVACYAELEWSNWQNTADHTELLNTYTVNSIDESWCADFVSYVYKEAGQPFTGGDVVGWDVAAAYEIKLQGFTMHDPDSYTPKPGDVAVFNYSGGHTEIVIKGGSHPTFLYGNSGTLDPTTGNGQMATNTITSDGANGELIYYLSKD